MKTEVVRCGWVGGWEGGGGKGGQFFKWDSNKGQISHIAINSKSTNRIVNYVLNIRNILQLKEC